MLMMKRLTMIMLSVLLITNIYCTDYVYLAYFSDAQCDDYVGSRAYFNEAVPIDTTSQADCFSELPCVYDANGAACQAISTGKYNISAIYKNGLFFETVSNTSPSNYTDGKCYSSSGLAHCFFQFFTPEQYSLFFQSTCDSSPSSFQADYSFATFYSDSSCSTFAGQRAFYSEGIEITGANSKSCESNLACLYNPTSKACAAVSSGVNSVISVTVNNDQTTELKDGIATVYSVGDCVQSSSYNGCYFKYFPQSYAEGRVDRCQTTPPPPANNDFLVTGEETPSSNNNNNGQSENSFDITKSGFVLPAIVVSLLVILYKLASRGKATAKAPTKNNCKKE